MYEGYLNLGGNEIGNTARAYGYTQTGDCPITWFRCDCTTMAEALGQDPYERANIDSAPWFDADIPDISSKFLGAAIMSVSGIEDSTRQAVVTQKTTSGGQVSGYRHATKQVRVIAYLTGVGREGLDYGMTWLRSALEPGACGAHGSACGTSSLEFFADCPPERQEGLTDEEYEDLQVTPLRRYLHGVVAVSGPLVQQMYQSSDNVHWGALVEYTLEAEEAFIYSATREVSVPPLTPTVIDDVPFNLAPYPSAEIAGSDIVVARNFSTNPSVETNATGWAFSTAVLSGSNPSPLTAAARSNDIATEGLWSYRVRLTATSGNSGSSLLHAYQDVNISTMIPGGRLSFHIWGALLATGSGGTPLLLAANVEWYNGVTPVGSTSSLTADPGSTLGGTVFRGKSLLPPAGANIARVRLTGQFNWVATTIMSLYADALAVTEP